MQERWRRLRSPGDDRQMTDEQQTAGGEAMPGDEPTIMTPEGLPVNGEEVIFTGGQEVIFEEEPGVPGWPATVRSVLSGLEYLLDEVPAERLAEPAANTGWTCRATLDHVASVLLHYAGQVLMSPRDHYLAFSVSLDRAKTSRDLLEVVVMSGAMLAAMVEQAPEEMRAWHPDGRFDADAYAAAGCAEMLLHGYDVAAALGLDWEAPDDHCDPVLELLFPAAYPLRPGVPSHEALLWATGRQDLPGRPRVTSWSYSEGAI